MPGDGVVEVGYTTELIFCRKRVFHNTNQHSNNSTLTDFEKYTVLLQGHKGIDLFDYDTAVDWAIDMLRRGVETENMLIISSFSKPVDKEEIKPYVSGVLKDLGLEEKTSEQSIIAHAHYYLARILEHVEERKNLSALYKLCLEADYKYGLTPFYLLWFAWSDLEEKGYNYYYETATLDNFEDILKTEAESWINKYIHGIDKEEQPQSGRKEVW